VARKPAEDDSAAMLPAIGMVVAQLGATVLEVLPHGEQVARCDSHVFHQGWARIPCGNVPAPGGILCESGCRPEGWSDAPGTLAE
jgi:hypothetical protein